MIYACSSMRYKVPYPRKNLQEKKRNNLTILFIARNICAMSIYNTWNRLFAQKKNKQYNLSDSVNSSLHFIYSWLWLEPHLCSSDVFWKEKKTSSAMRELLINIIILWRACKQQIPSVVQADWRLILWLLKMISI